MRERQAQIISTLSFQPEIDPAKEVEARVAFLRDYLVSSGASGFLLAVSGGQDSTPAGRLCQLAVEKLEREGIRAEFVAVRMPYVVQRDEEDAQLALAFIQPQQTVTFNIERGVDGVTDEYADAVKADMTDFTKGNVKVDRNF